VTRGRHDRLFAGGFNPGLSMARMSWRHFTFSSATLALLASCSQSVKEPERGLPPPAATAGTDSPSSARPRVSRAALAPALTKTKPLPPRGVTDSTPGASTPDALVDRAEMELARDDIEEATAHLEAALRARPDHRKALCLLARVSHAQAADLAPPLRTARYLQAAESVRRLRDTYKELTAQERELLAPLLYDEACTFAVEGKPDKALDSLAEAVAAGLDAFEMVVTDADLVSIRKLPRFGDLLREVEQKARAHATTAAKLIIAETTPFSFRFELPSITGEEVDLDSLKGKLILVNFWGTWCPPCRKEISPLKQLLAKYGDEGLTIVGINYERAADLDVKDTIRQFVAEHGIPFVCLIGNDTTRNQVPDFVGYPTTLLLDRSGTVRAKVAGYRTFIELEALVVLLLGEAQKKN
jgi:thiol-disulfide isomerase/thioredoxin